jgi:predicted small lipoprotein YifL
MAGLMLAAAALAALGGCGRRGQPELPQAEGAKAPETIPGLPSRGATRTEPVKPKQPFILDPLL